MLWFFLAFLAVVFLSFETIIDKILVVGKEKTLDPVVASFFRNLAFFVAIALFGVLGIFGKMQFFVTLPIVILGALWIFSSLAYDFMLKNAEISRTSSISHIFPLLLLPLDVLFFGTKFTVLMIFAILVLVVGALLLSFSFSKKGIRSLFSKKLWLFLFIEFVLLAFSLILFKKYNIANGLNEVSFYFSVWLFVVITYLTVLVIRGGWRKVPRTATENGFLAKTFISKLFDAVGVILETRALIFASMTSVEVIGSLFPLVVFLLAFVFQQIGFNLKEEFSSRSVMSKLIGIALLIVGSLMMVI
ncbi:MAG: hypothetical protein ACP5N2_03695 [Candidatus Nanoarchaeia archaeon]